MHKNVYLIVHKHFEIIITIIIKNVYIIINNNNNNNIHSLATLLGTLC